MRDPMHEIATPRLRLLPQRAAHADAMFAVLSDPAIYEYENEPPASAASLRERFARLESRWSPDARAQWLNWVVELRGSGLIGYVQATVSTSDSATIAYELGSAWWGRGLGGEAVEAMIGELVARHGVRRLRAVGKQRNERSIRLLRRLGFTPAGATRQAEAGVGPDEWLMERAAPAP
jgi:RimJ/RimL family protein N-acetyltransferase